MQISVSQKVFENNVGGNTTYVTNLYRHLQELGVDVSFLAPKAFLGTRARPDLRYGFSEARWALGSKRLETDVIHFPSDTGPVCRGRKPIVTTVHGFAAAHIDNVRTRKAAAIWKRRVRLAALASDAVITVSQSSSRDLQEHLSIPSNKLRVIHHGIDHGRFHTDRSGDRVPDTIITPGAPFLLYVGNLDPRKNIDRLLTAYGLFRGSNPEVKLIVAGKFAWGSPEILGRLERERGVTYLGQVDGHMVPALMRASSAFVFPSLYEGFGFPVLEAMACGTPVVTSDRGSLRELVHNGANIIDPESVESICAGLREVVESKSYSDDLRAVGPKIAARYNWSASASNHMQVFEEVRS